MYNFSHNKLEICADIDRLFSTILEVMVLSQIYQRHCNAVSSQINYAKLTQFLSLIYPDKLVLSEIKESIHFERLDI